MTDTRSDDDLMHAFAAGDVAAFQTLYARHQAALYRFVRRLLGPQAATQADEVFQDAWMKLIRARREWQPQGARLRTWLFTIAHHRAVDCLRQSGREISTTRDDDDDEGEPWQPAAAPWAGWPAADATTAEDQAFWRSEEHTS